MAVPFSNTKLRPPPGFRNILCGLAREVLRSQPKDIYAFGTLYLEQLLKIRQENGFDPSQVGADFEDRYYNKVFMRTGERIGVEERAALRIQTAYRRYRAKVETEALRKDRAALKIQAGFIGFLARKKVKHLRADWLTARDKAKQIADLEDAEDIDKFSEFPAMTSYQDAADDPDEQKARDFKAAKMATAVARIQAGFHGLQTRRANQAFFEPYENDGMDHPSLPDNSDVEDFNIPLLPGERVYSLEAVNFDHDGN